MGCKITKKKIFRDVKNRKTLINIYRENYLDIYARYIWKIIFEMHFMSSCVDGLFNSVIE